MQPISDINRFGEHRNGFGFLRLLFASLVIVSHTPELADGDRRREILSQIFHTISFGELAVDGFFLISGYLIVGSYLKNPNLTNYLTKRVGRIYPGFIVASIFCLLVVAPLAGATIVGVGGSSIGAVVRLLLLQPPTALGAFADSHYPYLNGAMWTISIEFKCYLFVILLGKLGLLTKNAIVPIASFGLFAVYQTVSGHFWNGLIAPVPHLDLVIGDIRQEARLLAVFLAGSMFYVWKDDLRFSRRWCLAAGVALILCLFRGRLAEPAFALFGGYLIFAFASWNATGFVMRINNRNDISYGVYLYAWPLEKLLLLYLPTVPLVAIGLVTFVLACLFGWLSWHLVEKPVMRWLRPKAPAAPVALLDAAPRA